MCGIAGIVGFTDPSDAERRTRVMSCVQARRGPDGEGTESWTAACLGHRRLAIFDLSPAGHQPMCSEDRRVGVVFNGALYNFKELRFELEKKGYRFNSQTDTEVLIHGYLEWGADGLVKKLHGMFAFALWDNEQGKLFLVRDRLGVKPLFYTVTPEGGVAFASTSRALRRAGFLAALDPLSLLEYLEFGFVPEERSIFLGCQKLPAATILEWSAEQHRIETRAYWSHSTVSPDLELSFEDAVDHIEDMLLKAVQLRLEADVPVGALLSGGVDSSLVCWAITKLGADVTAYTIGTPEDVSDETDDAVFTAQRLGIKHQVLNVGRDSFPDVHQLAAAFDEPFACASALGMLNLSKAIAGNATVLLTGDGGDDLFLGYPEHRKFQMAENIARAMPQGFGAILHDLSGHLSSHGRFGRVAYFTQYATGGVGAVAARHDGIPMLLEKDVLGEQLCGLQLDRRNLKQSVLLARQMLSDFLVYDQRTRFVGEYLPKVDGATMYYGVEARSPFLDQEMWQYASRLPFGIRMHKGRLKAILREIARRRIHPRIANGKKRGFTIPVGSWLTGPGLDIFQTVLHDSILEREGWVNGARLSQWAKDAVAANYIPRQLWYIFVLELWMDYEQSNASQNHNEIQSNYRLVTKTSAAPDAYSAN